MAEGSSTSEAVVTRSQTRVKTEDDSDSMGEHSHNFNVKFDANDQEEYTIYCDQPCTVLEAIQSHEEYQKRMKCADENILIQLGNEDKEFAIPTHFPCSCIEDGKLLIIHKSEKVEKAQNKPSKTIHPRNKYYVFYIATEGGKYTRTKKLFRNTAMKQFTYLCVYGEKGMTVEESLKRDGRFIDDLGDFKLSDNKNPNKLTGCKQMVDRLDQKKFKICLPQIKRENDKKLQEKPCVSSRSQRKRDSAPVLDAQQSGTRVKTLEKNDSNVNTAEIYERLRQQFPSLKRLMEDRFPDNSYQEAVNLKKQDFGKIQQSFSEVHRVRELLKLSESVCLLKIDCFSVTTQGTGFVLFDNIILTNAHLFNEVVKLRRDNWREYVKVTADFNYENPDLESNRNSFNINMFFVELTDNGLDYAVFELDPDGQKPNQTTETKKITIPPGLLKRFGPLPTEGEACIVGHPAGGVKQMDPTCIIEKQKREQAVNDHLEPYRNSLITLYSICQVIRDQGIEKIMHGKKADEVATYNTFMYHGSSGSPVFDAHCRVFGLHTAGFVHGFPKHTENVIEFAQPLLTIFERLLTKIKESGDEKLLKRVEEEAKGNPYLETVFESVERMEISRVEEEAKGNPDLKVEPEDSNESMDTN